MKNPSHKSILIVSGEASGDKHGADLIRSLNSKSPNLKFFGIGGDEMAKEGMDIIYHAKDMAFLGFLEVVRHLPFIKKVFRELLIQLKTRKPDLVILIDYPGFNLRFATKAKKLGFPVVYYISPQVWAWGKGRVKKMARIIDLMMVIFPFEETFFQKAGIPVRFVGHPLKGRVQPSQSREDFLAAIKLAQKKPIIGLLPGSRKQEIQRILPEIMEAFQRIQKQIPDCQGILGLSPTLPDFIYRPYLKGNPAIRAIREKTYDIMSYSDIVLVASGTATLETALAGTPMIILYKMAPISYWIGKRLVSVDHVGMVNIIAGRKIVPELLQNQANGSRIAEEALSILYEPKQMDLIKRDLQNVSDKLGEPGASGRAADTVLHFMNHSSEFNSNIQ